jgi:hypothetical protein
VELCSYSVRPPNETRPSFGGFVLTDLYLISSPSLPSREERRWPGHAPPCLAITLKIPLAERVDHLRLARHLCSLGQRQAICQVAAP